MKLTKLGWLFFILFIVGCTGQRVRGDISTDRLQKIRNVAVVSNINHWMNCIYHGFSWKGINSVDKKYNKYLIKPNLNSESNSRIISELKKRGVNAVPEPDVSVSYLDYKTSSKEWSNIKIDTSRLEKSNYDALVLMMGEFRYFSAFGFFKRNGLRNIQYIYIYDLKSKKLIVRNNAEEYYAYEKFTCESLTIPSHLKIQGMAVNTFFETQNQLLNEILP